MAAIHLTYTFPGRTQAIKDDLRALFEVEVTQLPSGAMFGRIFYVQMRDPRNLHRFVYAKLLFEFRDQAVFYMGRRFGIEFDPDHESRLDLDHQMLQDASDGCDELLKVVAKIDQWLRDHRVDVH